MPKIFRPDDINIPPLPRFQSWIFDLDNTLYEADLDFFQQVSNRMTVYLCHYFGLDAIGARALQHYYYQKYGTTLRGLMLHDGVKAKDFLDFTHDIDYGPITQRPSLVRAIKALSGKKIVLTNGPESHAVKTLDRLGLKDEFDGIQDIILADHIPKPAPEPYQRMAESFNLKPDKSIIFEDLPQNLIIPKAMGMTTVLVVNAEHKMSTGEHLEALPQHLSTAIDWMTSNLTDFLDWAASST